MIELRKIFTAESKSVADVLGRGIGFYIPPYQRQYDWDDGHIRRLFEDINHGLSHLLMKEKKHSITFIGTLIVIDDTRPETIAPNIFGSDMPDKILSIIDGQQRLTTILLMNIRLHDEIRRRSIEIKDKGEFAFEWLYDRAIQVDAELQETFEVDKRRPESIYRWQPRMIRAYDDLWARSENEAKYRSPIAAFIHGYSRCIHDNGEGGRNDPYTGENYIDNSGVLWKNYVEIQRLIEAISGRERRDQEPLPLKLLPLEQIAEDLDFQEAILKERLPEDVCDILSNEDNNDFKELIRLIFFANFLMNRVGVTVVSAPGTYAFEMFESLNTTGEPLTIFETFRPKVIESEGLTKYENSDSRKYMIPIEKYLNQFDDAQERQKETARLLIPFALAESGRKLPSDVRDQRQYMRNEYENLQNIEEKRNFVQHLSHVAQFMSNAWRKGDRAFLDITEFTDRSVVLMCMDVLGKANPVTIGPLARFYSQVLLASSDSRDAAINELEEAMKAMTAFFALWRGSGGTTGSLAAQYRDVMEKGYKDAGILPFARYLGEEKETSEFLTAEKLRKFLRDALESSKPESMTSKAYWVRLSSQRPIYRVSQALTRFLLFASIHDTVDDDENLGLTVSGLPGILDMLTWEKWSSNLTIEHIAPQSPEQNGWDDSLYERPDLVNYLGNLTLLPDVKNSSLGNRPWQEKKAMFYILAAPTPEEQKARLTTERERGIELADRTENLLRAGRYFHHLSAISNAEEWTPQFVQDRSVRLAELIWTNIAPWLGFDD